MDECCNTCGFCMKLKRYDYSGKGCEHSDMDGFACTLCEDEGIVVQMVGISKHNGLCEGYKQREEGKNEK